MSRLSWSGTRRLRRGVLLSGLAVSFFVWMGRTMRDRGFKRVQWVGGPQDGGEVTVPNHVDAIALPFTTGETLYPIVGDRVFFTHRTPV